MRIRTTQRLQEEDVPQEQRKWASKIIGVFNDYISQSIKIVNDGIVFPDNFQGKEHVFDFVYQSDALSLPLGFLWRLSLPPKSFQVVAATEDNDPLNCSVSWQFTEKGQVELVSIVKFTTAPAIAALTAGSRYKIRVRVTP
jgi:hypothetical protein